MTNPDWTRRTFLKIGAAASGGLLIAAAVPACGSGSRPDPEAEGGDRPAGPPTSVNAFVEIAPDGRVILTSTIPEIGQGVSTALPMILAEELDVDWSAVEVRQAEVDDRYDVAQAAAGSDSVADSWEPLRRAGAAARAMLVGAAAARWGVPEDECATVAGEVVHEPSGRRLGYGALAAEAARLPAPEDPPLKNPAEFRIVGTRRAGVGAKAIVTGRAAFGIDVRHPGMLRAAVARCPVVGGRLAGFDEAAALAVPGVRSVHRIDPVVPREVIYGAVRPGVAVVADHTWAAFRGRDALAVEWDEGRWGEESTERIARAFSAAADGPPDIVLRDEGNAGAALESAALRLEAEYALPVLPHACMEPMNFFADVRDGGCEVEGPIQNPPLLRALLAAALELEPERVRVRPSRSGGGFGRRLSVDYGVEAALVSRAAAAPVQVVWTREDDFLGDYFRTPALHRLEGGLDGDRRAVAWRHRIVVDSLARHITAGEVESPAVYDVQGAADLAYDIAGFRVEYSAAPVGLRLGSWRSVAHSYNVFATASFADEMARAAGADPLEFLLALVGDGDDREIVLPLPGRRGRTPFSPRRARRAIEAAARAAGWGGTLPAGSGRGIAFSVYKASYAAAVADVTVDGSGVSVDRIVTALDCGIVVNPAGLEKQMEGAALDGVATVLKWGIDVDRGRPAAVNFDDYPMLRASEAPEVVPVILESDEPPSGSGEPPYPAAPPAIGNALFDATGVRARRLPLPAGWPNGGAT